MTGGVVDDWNPFLAKPFEGLCSDRDVATEDELADVLECDCANLLLTFADEK